MDPKIRVIISIILPAIIFIGVSIPLIVEKIPRNAAYGFRTKKTLMNDEIWYKANKFGGISVMVAAMFTLFGCSVLYLNREKLSFDELNNIGFGLFVVPVMLAVILSLVYIKKL